MLAAWEALGLSTNGAGREPDWRNTALTTMMALAATAARIANESTGRRAVLAHRRDAKAPPAAAVRA
jgi:hypothetical protein